MATSPVLISNSCSFPALIIRSLSLAISLAASAPSLAATDDYNQCIDRSAKRKSGQDTTTATEAGCAKRLENVGSNELDLPSEALNKLVVNAGFGWGIFSGTVYNGNKDYVLTGVTVLLTPPANNKSDQTPASGTEYDIALALEPLAKGSLSMPVPSDNTLEYAWKITKARGYKAR
ncbi:hypothetical protein [Nitrosospira sp. Is2]|uniref:hypothetical protein n=1 Tax=Nitrosospira sp. Is2 TaxID=3080532 RepID=UPI000D4BA370|nr:hypothetical protein [Nitrosospira sp. Is2]PTR14134.1 hypothetical protein C8R31_10727 [Nitrosospira sp. Nsp2]WON75191.1 hypothetical protein R5L00_06855 [Nitrosospira sp. Is2]